MLFLDPTLISFVIQPAERRTVASIWRLLQALITWLAAPPRTHGVEPQPPAAALLHPLGGPGLAAPLGPAQPVGQRGGAMTASFVFYEKPGCLSNARQKAPLGARGHRLAVRDLLSEPWTPERPVAEWFKPSAPRVKSGEVRPADLDNATALALMVSEPILIRRALMEVCAALGAAVVRTCGFEAGHVLASLGIELGLTEDVQSCANPAGDAHCPYPGGP
jgi:nitrogenase-associated protein